MSSYAVWTDNRLQVFKRFIGMFISGERAGHIYSFELFIMLLEQNKLKTIWADDSASPC